MPAWKAMRIAFHLAILQIHFLIAVKKEAVTARLRGTAFPIGLIGERPVR